MDNLIGVLYDMDEEEIQFHSNNEEFINSTEELQRLALYANSPWSQTHQTYVIKFNCKDSYTKKASKCPNFVCICSVVGYEAITSEIYGYGETPQEALDDCIKMFDRLQKEYNPNDKYF